MLELATTIYTADVTLQFFFRYLSNSRHFGIIL